MKERFEKNRIVLLVAMAVAFTLSLVCLSACGNTTEQRSRIKVVYELEGGKYLNSELPVVVYYDFGNNSEPHRIRDLTSATSESLDRAGYTFDGWYREKSGEGDAVSYSGLWDFESDLATIDGVTLYAKWKPNVEYKYSMYYKDGDELVFYKSETLYKGEKFDNKKAERSGYTVLRCFNESGEPWNYDFENDIGDVKVIVEYLDGEYVLVDTYAKLVSSVRKNIYLTADIDCGGASFNFDDYSGRIFKGNGHSVSNFVLESTTLKTFENQKALLVSLFGEMRNSSVEDVEFSGVTVKIKLKMTSTRKIYVSPLAISVQNSKISGVKFSGTVEAEESEDAVMDNLIVIADREYYLSDEISVYENNEIILEK